MSWSDRIPSLSPLIWGGIVLFSVNTVILTISLLSADHNNTDDGDYPVIKMLEIDNLEEPSNNSRLEPRDKQNALNHEEHSIHNKQDSGLESTKSRHPVVKQKEVINERHERVCYEIGPLKSDVEFTELQSLVDVKGMHSTLKYNTAEGELGYWVFIPPLRSRALVRLKAEELKLKGFNDVVILTRNEPVNAVSLGVFKDQKSAYTLLLRAQSLGFDAKMDIRYQSLGDMWLSVEVSKYKDLDDLGWGELLADYQHVQFQAVNCL